MLSSVSQSHLSVNVCHSCSLCAHTHVHPHVRTLCTRGPRGSPETEGTERAEKGRCSPASNGVCSDTSVPGPSWAVAGGRGCPPSRLPGAQELCRRGQGGCGARPVPTRDSAFHARQDSGPSRAAHAGVRGRVGGPPPVRMHRNQSQIRPRSHPDEGPAALAAGTARPPAGRRRTSRGSAPRLPAGLSPAASFPPSDGPAWQAVPAQVRDCLGTLVAVPRVSSRALSRPTPRTWAPPFSVPRLGHFGGLDSLPTAGLWKAGPVALCRAPCSESFCFALSSGLAGTPAVAVWPFPSEARSSR